MKMELRLIMEAHDHNFWQIALASIFANLIFGHNLWLIAKDRMTGRGQVRIEVNTSDNFPASESAVRPERVADFRFVTAGGSVPITEYRIEEQSLVAVIEPPREGACLVALELHPHPITLEAEKFARYIQDEEAHAMVAPRFQAGVTDSPQRESYIKYAKVWLGSSTRNDEAHRLVVGHKLEIVPQIDPATLGVGDKLPIRVLFAGEPIENLRVSCGGEHLHDGGYAAHARTDRQGYATLEITRSDHWFVRAHYIRPHPDIAVADWESFWASITFRLTLTDYL